MPNSGNHHLPFSESYWVIPGQFLAGEHPAGYNEESTRKRLQALLKTNVSVFFDFTEKFDSRLAYRDWLIEEAAGYGLNVAYHNFPIRDFSAPTPEVVINILDEIDAAIAVGKTIYTHCIAGIGRTGTIVGCYLVRHGISGEAALQQIAALRSGTPSWWKHSPEDPSQVELILNWKNGM